MKRALYIAGPFGLALLVIAAGWGVLVPREWPVFYKACLVLGVVLVLASAWGRRTELFAQGGVRTARFGAGAVGAAGLALSILLLVNFAAARYTHRWDLTRNGAFSLHPVTQRALKAVTKDVDVYAFFPSSDITTTRAARETYDAFTYANPLIHVTVVDPTQRPDLVEKLGVRGTKMTIVQAGDHRAWFPNFGEAELAGALLEVARDAPKVVYWVIGHGEREVELTGGAGYLQLEKELKKSYFQLRSLSLAPGEKVPADASLLVFADPRKPLPAAEIDAYQEWLRNGHRALVLVDVDLEQAAGQKTPLAGLLEPWGLNPLPAVIVDPRSRTGETDPRIVVGDEFGRHPATQSLAGQRAVFPLARPLEFGQVMSDQQIFHHALVKVGPDTQGKGNDAYATYDLASVRDAGKPDATARAQWGEGKPLNLALTAFRKFEARDTAFSGREARIVLFGDADFLNDKQIDRESNRELALNVVRWLTGEELLIRREGEIRSAKTAMAVEPAQLSFVLALGIVIPVATVLAGWVVWFGRRSK